MRDVDTYRGFEKDVALGSWAVQAAVEYMSSKSGMPSETIVSVEDDEFFRNMDVDLVVTSIAGQSWVEVKGDTFKTNNVYLETISNCEKGTPGCMMYTCADFIFYYFVSRGQALIIPVVELQEWMSKNLHRFTAKRVGNRAKRGGTLFTSEGYPVPQKVLMKEIPGLRVIKGLPILEKQS
jgi:hypothetical protein